MRRFGLPPTVMFLALCLLSAYPMRADDAPKVDAPKKLQVLVVAGGHRYPVKPFHELFKSFPDMKCTFVTEKAGGEAFDNIDGWPYDVIVLYNHNRKPSEKRRQNFLKLMDRGVGLVILHHGLHGYRYWPEFKKIAGVTSFVSGSKDNVKYRIHIEDPRHPIVKGMHDFTVKDENLQGGPTGFHGPRDSYHRRADQHQGHRLGSRLSQVAGLLPAIGPRRQRLRPEGVSRHPRQRDPLVSRATRYVAEIAQKSVRGDSRRRLPKKPPRTSERSRPLQPLKQNAPPRRVLFVRRQPSGVDRRQRIYGLGRWLDHLWPALGVKCRLAGGIELHGPG